MTLQSLPYYQRTLRAYYCTASYEKHPIQAKNRKLMAIKTRKIHIISLSLALFHIADATLWLHKLARKRGLI